MHYVQKYVENLPALPKLPKWTMFKSKDIKANGELPNNVKKTNIFLYCNYYSYYSQKVLMVMYEKNIDFVPIFIDITKGEQYSSWFLDLNPRGEIPVLKVNNNIIPDSTRIIDYLENYLDSELPPLVNISTDGKVVSNIEKFRELLELIPSGIITLGSFFQPHLCGTPKIPFILPVRELLKTADISNSNNLRRLAEENPKAKDVLLYKAELQERKQEILHNEEEYVKILSIVDKVFTEVENQLKTQIEGNWLCCENFSIADINLAVLLQRLWELGFEDRYWAKGKRPLVENYYERVKQRESFKKAMPSLPFHLKMIVMSQPPAYIAAAGAVSVGLVLTMFYILKKLVR